jgi:hypothetical protein
MKRLAPTTLLLAFALAACGSEKADQAATATPEVPSSDFIAENPTEPAVPVKLPDTPMTMAPTADASPAKAQ